VIAYAGRSLNKQERNYCVTRRELLAIVHFTRHFRQYLLGRQFVIRNDHAALTWLQRTPEPIGHNARWLELLGEFSFDINHRAGTSHGTPTRFRATHARSARLAPRAGLRVEVTCLLAIEPHPSNPTRPAYYVWLRLDRLRTQTSRRRNLMRQAGRRKRSRRTVA